MGAAYPLGRSFVLGLLHNRFREHDRSKLRMGPQTKKNDVNSYE